MVLTSAFLQNSSIAAWFTKVVDCFRFLLNECRVTVNAQKGYFQEQLKRNKIFKYQKILTSMAGPV